MFLRRVSAASWAAAAVFGVSLTASSLTAAEPGNCRPVGESSDIELVGRRVVCPPCPCPPAPVCPPSNIHEVMPTDPTVVPSAPTPADDSAEPTDTDQMVEDAFNPPVQQPAPAPSNNLALSSGASSATGAQAFAPGMIGDYFGTGGSGGTLQGFIFGPLSPHPLAGNVAGAPQARIGVQKLSEGTSPIPRDRFILNYSAFSNAAVGEEIDVHRGVVGVEKTFNCGQSSVEVRLPFASTLDSNLTQTSPLYEQTNSELGDLTVYFKQILSQSCRHTLSAGLGFSLPTSDDVNYDGVIIESESIHLYPFLGSLWTPNDRLFVQNFLQFDFDVNGNTVSAGTQSNKLQDRNDLYWSTSLGYWIYKDTSCCSTGFIKGIAPQLEFHYNQSISNADTVAGPEFVITGGDAISLFDGTIGLTMVTRNGGTMTFGYAVPLNGDEQFDNEIRVMFSMPLGSH